MSELTPLEQEAIAKARKVCPALDDSWRPYYFQKLDGPQCLIRGCNTTVFKRGKRKGQTKYLTKEGHLTFVLDDPKR